MAATANSEGVTVQLNGSPVTLRYTLGAAKKINAQFGSFLEAYARVAKIDFAALALVVAAALGKEVAEVEDTVFGSGLTSLSVDLSTYLAWLSNGGRDPKVAVADDKGTDSGNA